MKPGSWTLTLLLFFATRESVLSAPNPLVLEGSYHHVHDDSHRDTAKNAVRYAQAIKPPAREAEIVAESVDVPRNDTDVYQSPPSTLGTLTIEEKKEEPLNGTRSIATKDEFKPVEDEKDFVSEGPLRTPVAEIRNDTTQAGGNSDLGTFEERLDEPQWEKTFADRPRIANASLEIFPPPNVRFMAEELRTEIPRKDDSKDDFLFGETTSKPFDGNRDAVAERVNFRGNESLPNLNPLSGLFPKGNGSSGGLPPPPPPPIEGDMNVKLDEEIAPVKSEIQKEDVYETAKPISDLSAINSSIISGPLPNTGPTDAKPEVIDKKTEFDEVTPLISDFKTDVILVEEPKPHGDPNTPNVNTSSEALAKANDSLEALPNPTAGIQKEGISASGVTPILSEIRKDVVETSRPVVDQSTGNPNIQPVVLPKLGESQDYAPPRVNEQTEKLDTLPPVKSEVKEEPFNQSSANPNIQPVVSPKLGQSLNYVPSMAKEQKEKLDTLAHVKSEVNDEPFVDETMRPIGDLSIEDSNTTPGNLPNIENLSIADNSTNTSAPLLSDNLNFQPELAAPNGSLPVKGVDIDVGILNLSLSTPKNPIAGDISKIETTIIAAKAPENTEKIPANDNAMTSVGPGTIYQNANVDKRSQYVNSEANVSTKFDAHGENLSILDDTAEQANGGQEEKGNSDSHITKGFAESSNLYETLNSQEHLSYHVSKQEATYTSKPEVSESKDIAISDVNSSSKPFLIDVKFYDEPELSTKIPIDAGGSMDNRGEGTVIIQSLPEKDMMITDAGLLLSEVVTVAPEVKTTGSFFTAIWSRVTANKLNEERTTNRLFENRQKPTVKPLYDDTPQHGEDRPSNQRVTGMPVVPKRDPYATNEQGGFDPMDDDNTKTPDKDTAPDDGPVLPAMKKRPVIGSGEFLPTTESYFGADGPNPEMKQKPREKYISGQNTDMVAAVQFLHYHDKESSDQCFKLVSAHWNYATNLTEENKKKQLVQTLEYSKFDKAAWRNATSFAWKAFNDSLLRRWFRSLSVLGTAALNDERLNELTRLKAEMKLVYSTVKVCAYSPSSPRQKKEVKINCNLALEPDLTRIMAKSRDYNELLHVWKAWREASGKPIRKKFLRFVELSNEAATLNGFSDTGEMWRESYESETFQADLRDLWEQIRPLYEHLHAYVRRRLIWKYGSDKIKRDGPIPAHLFGNMWGQSWSSLLDITEPFPGKPSIDVTTTMQARNYTAYKMFRTSEEFFTSLGLKPMPEAFWKHSIMEKPKDRDIICHASAWDFCNGKDYRIKMCTDITMQDLVTVHHEMGHIQYFLQYARQPNVFREGANPGFHEAIGDVLALSVSTPKHLQTIGLLEEVADDPKGDLNFLMKTALEKVAFLPSGYLIDLWRWGLFSGDIKPSEMNTKWWELRFKYQGICPPVRRDEEDFDPGSKYHIPGNVPYIRYFVSFIIQFQFHKVLCDAAGHKGPLHKCDIYRSKEAGQILSQVMEIGSSEHWSEAMKIMTGGASTKMDAKPILEYFEPLLNFLKEENKNEIIGWDSDDPTVCP